MSKKIAVASEESCGFSQDSYGRRVSWGKNIPIKIILSNSWPKKYTQAAKRAAQKWNDKAEVELIKIDENSINISKTPEFDYKNGLYWLDHWSEEDKYIQGLTSLLYSKGLARDADIKINAKHFNYYTDEPASTKDLHLESLLIHEIGHLLGLKHYMTPPSVMGPSLFANYARVKISKTDVESLACEYKK